MCGAGGETWLLKPSLVVAAGDVTQVFIQLQQDDCLKLCENILSLNNESLDP